MGNLGSRKKQKDELAEDVWMKLNDDQPSPKNKKKKKKKRILQVFLFLVTFHVTL
jgi:hypothetical protein